MNTRNIVSTAGPSLSPGSRQALAPGDEALALLAESLQPHAPEAAIASALRQRLARRVGASAARHRDLRTVRSRDQRWQVVTRGVRACVVHDDGIVRSAFVEFAPGSKVPGHRHHAHEECIVLSGGLTSGDLIVGPHDYHLAPSGSKHPAISSEQGATIFLRGTSIGNGPQMVKELLTAWLPGKGPAPSTVHAGDGQWEEAGEGARVKRLWAQGNAASLLVQLDPGGRLPGHAHDEDEECVVLAGEVFFGDVLLGGGDYQRAPRGTHHGEVSSDVGGLLFIHTTADFARLM